MKTGTKLEQTWYTQRELSEYLGICESTLWRWRKDKRFPQPHMRVRRNGKLRGGRYHIKMVEAFMRHKL
ncbi:helix-turn-helix domain-containing protein [Shewanella sp. 202IG2-18]|uniref:helix-turn-helix transcriptional regulator n=1 Tax=Parashewanella hymeniacidonis TaxID=2807618 RepID=UPI00196052BF|nr:helix-turn-helix domain-containing protein [Parashewanella hymeniacidonis]MBM7070756.1 helix-turn-helix domain-containing protein [Parashewanella hymeniacidonis]